VINSGRGHSAADKNKTKNFRRMNQLVEYIIYGLMKYSENKAAREGKQHTVTEDDKASLGVNQHMMSNINTTQ
jgi:hypothetical protein